MSDSHVCITWDDGDSSEIEEDEFEEELSEDEQSEHGEFEYSVSSIRFEIRKDC